MLLEVFLVLVLVLVLQLLRVLLLLLLMMLVLLLAVEEEAGGGLPVPERRRIGRDSALVYGGPCEWAQEYFTDNDSFTLVACLLFFL